MLARKTHLKIPLFIPSSFPMRWLLPYVEQDSSTVGKGIKTIGDKHGIAGMRRKVSQTCSFHLQTFTLPLTNRCIFYINRSAPSLTHLFTNSLHHPVAAAVSTERDQGTGPHAGTTPQHPRPPSSSPSWSNLCSPQSIDDLCTVLLFQTYWHQEYPQACRFWDAHCSSGYKVRSHLKHPGIHPLRFAVFLKKIIKLPANKMQWNKMGKGFCPWHL